MIHGLSDKRRLPRLGKIKLGVLVQASSGKSYPKATDYFVVPTVVAKVHGDRPTSLPIMFPVDDPAILFPQAYKMYRRSGLYCAGDGQTARRWDAGELKERTCPCEYLESGECKPLATLNFLLPDVPGLGVWQISTSSERSIISLNSSMADFAVAFGGLRGIPFTLILEAEQTQRWDEQKKAMVAQTVHVLRLDTPHTLNEIVAWRRALGKPVEALMPAPEQDDEERLALTAGAQHAPADQSPSEPSGAQVASDYQSARLPAGGGAQQEDAAHDVIAPASDVPGQAPAWAPDVKPEPGPEPEPFDVTRCFTEARECGVSPELYTRYLQAAYTVDVDNLAPEHLAQEQRQFSEAQTPATRAVLKAEIVKLVNTALRKRSPTATPMTARRRGR